MILTVCNGKFIFFHEDAEFNDPHYELNEASACCMPSEKIEEAIIPQFSLV
jgi:hypothetical protein